MKDYKENKTDPQLNMDILNKEFDVLIKSEYEINKIQNVVDMRKELKDIQEDYPDSDKIILDNIDRANRILDIIEYDIKGGDHSARLLEVVGQLINAVTSAATSVTGISYNQQIIDNKNRALDIKEKEIDVKSIIKGSENVNITNNNLIMSREELLEMINE